MTAVGEVVPRRDGTSAPPRRATASWRVATRIARREVRRRWGRTLLVAALIAVPVGALATALVLVRSQELSAADRFSLEHGPVADLVLKRQMGALREERLVELLPTGSRWTRYGTGESEATVADPARLPVSVALTDLPLDDPLVGSTFDLRRGRPPAAGEVVVAETVARQLDLDVGEEVYLGGVDAGDRRTVSGVGRLRAAHDRPIVVGLDFDWAGAGNVTETTLVDVPGEPDAGEAAAILERLQGGRSRAETADGHPPSVGWERVAWGWIAGALGLVAVGIVVASAFAITSRRQLVTVGQLSAQGAAPSVIRRVVALQGAWSGGLGGIVGIAGALAAVRLGRPLIELLMTRDLVGVRVFAFDLALVFATGVVVATVAALVPAVAFARVPTASALAGRRPMGRVPPHLLPVSVALFGGGVAVLALVARSGRAAAIRGSTLEVTRTRPVTALSLAAVLGGLGVVLSVCCLSPALVDVVSSRGGRAGGASRLALRSLGRARAASAGVVTAVAVAVAVAVAGSTVTATAAQPEPRPVDEGSFRDLPPMPADTVLVEAHRNHEMADEAPDGPLPSADVPVETRTRLDRLLPGPRWDRFRVATYDRPGSGDHSPGAHSGLIVADPGVLRLIGLSDHDRERLDTVGAMIVDRDTFRATGIDAAPDQVVEVDVGSADAAVTRTITLAVRRDLPRHNGGPINALITEESARAAGLTIVERGAVVRSPDPLTGVQRAKLYNWNREAELDRPASGDTTGRPADDGTSIGMTFAGPVPGRPDVFAVQAALVFLAMLLTLTIIGISLALTAAESRDETAVLVALGAPPATLRRMAGMRALALAAAGCLLAVPAGLLPTLVVVGSLTDRDPAVAWPALLVLVVMVPAVAGVGAWAIAALARTGRGPDATVLAVD